MHEVNFYSIEAEAGVIGSSLMSNKAYRNIADQLRPEDFYNAEHAMYWETFGHLDARGQQFDAITVAEFIHRKGDGEHLANLGRLVKECHGTHNAYQYAAIIKDRAKHRRMVSACQEAIDRARAGDKGAIEFAQESILAIGEESQGNDPEILGDVIKKHVDVLELRNRGEAKGISTGFTDLDRMTGGLRGGQVAVIAARPKMGKTTFAVNIAERIASDGNPALIFSLEMSQTELADRITASQAKINSTNLTSGQLEEDEWQRVGPAFAQMKDWPLWLDDSVNITITDVRAKARRVKAKSGLSVILIDYLGLMDGIGENQNLKIAEITRGTKKLAKELNVPVILLAQLNRDLEKRADKIPQLSDLRDSGAIEQDADMVMFLYNDEIYNPNTELKGTTMVKLAAQRSGPTGCFYLTNNLKYSRFENCERRYEDGDIGANGSTGYSY